MPCIGTEFGTLQIRQHIRSVEIPDVEIPDVEIPDVEITSVDCSKFTSPRFYFMCLVLFLGHDNSWCQSFQ